MGRRVPDDLLDDVEGEDLRRRRALLEWLLDRNFTVEELRAAKDEERLALLPTEHVLTRGCSLSLDDAAHRSGLARGFVERAWRAAGIPIPVGPEPVVDDEDLEAMHAAKAALDGGISEARYLEVSRVVGRAASAIAEAVVETADDFASPGDREADFAMRLEAATEQLVPLVPTLVAFPIRQHIRQAIRHQALEREHGGVEGLRGTRRLAVGFADLVGYSSLSERASVSESSDFAAKLEALATAAAEPPVRLVKLIGDEAMLVSDEVEPLVHALVQLRTAAADAAELPPLHLGVAVGDVVARAGDVYGPTVNRAARLTAASEPGQLLLAPEAVESLEGSFELRELSPIELKGVGRLRPFEIPP